ncbi:hypothetical protein Acsp05_41740 [Actinokineospora sp. NBRC 105648]|nr:hypothetical protein Acsp05_41740 [Actinokineospora sp. NBRC 105648]
MRSQPKWTLLTPGRLPVIRPQVDPWRPRQNDSGTVTTKTCKGITDIGPRCARSLMVASVPPSTPAGCRATADPTGQTRASGSSNSPGFDTRTSVGSSTTADHVPTLWSMTLWSIRLPTTGEAGSTRPDVRGSAGNHRRCRAGAAQGPWPSQPPPQVARGH